MATGMRRRLDIGHVYSGKGICCNRIHNICDAKHKLHRTCFCFAIQSRMSSVVRYSAGSTKNSLRNTCHAGTCTRPGNILSGIISSKLRCDVDTIIMVLCKCHLWMQAQLISGTASKTRPVRQLYSGKS